MDSPRSPTDDREAPYCRRCGQYAEPDDFYCWSCGGEEEVLAGQTVPHIYYQGTGLGTIYVGDTMARVAIGRVVGSTAGRE